MALGLVLRLVPGHHAKVTRLRINGIKAAIGARFHPGDVVADRPDLPAFVMRRRNEHGEVGFAASAGESGRDKGLLALGRFHPQDEHVFGHPAFVPAQVRANPQRQTLLAQQHVAAVTRADREDGVILREMADVAAVGVHVQHRVQAAIEIVAAAQVAA